MRGRSFRPCTATRTFPARCWCCESCSPFYCCTPRRILLAKSLYSHRREHVTLRIVSLVVAFNLICGIVLIYTFGLIGAAVTALLTWLLNGLLHFLATREQLADESGQNVSWGSTLIVPVVAAGSVMAGAFALATQLNFIVASILTSILYLIVLAVFVYVACSGALGVRERFLVPLRER